MTCPGGFGGRAALHELFGAAEKNAKFEPRQSSAFKGKAFAPFASALLLLAALLPSCAASSTDCGGVIEVRFVRCIDGDTFVCEIPGGRPQELMGNDSVRIRGIDAPELHDRSPEARQRALESKAYLERRLSEARRIELRCPAKDKYFRILADVFIDGSGVAREMLERGLAAPYSGGARMSGPMPCAASP